MAHPISFSRFPKPSPVNQKGAVLIVVLMMLLMVTLLGINGMRVNSMEERAVSNYRSGSVAFQAAEAALRECIMLVSTSAYTGTYLSPATGVQHWEAASNWTNSDSVAVNIAATLPPEVKQAPRCKVESLTTGEARITAYAQSRDGTISIVQANMEN